VSTGIPRSSRAYDADLETCRGLATVAAAASRAGTTAWVLESGECNSGDHEIVEVFIGTEGEAIARAAELSRSRSPLDVVDAFAYPVTRGASAEAVIREA
jgi:hypothetical protein